MTVRTILFAIGVSALPFCVPLLGLTRQGGGVGVVAGVAGLLGALAMWWQVLLGARQVAARLSRDRGAVVALHRWLGGCGAFLVLVHPLLELVADRQDALYLVRIDFTWVESAYISLGRIALGLFLALWLTSTLLRAAVRHRVWRHTHYVSYPLVALVFLHADGVGSSLSGLPWLRAYWLALAWSFALVVAWRLAAPLWSRRYRLTGAERISPTVTRYTLEPVGRPLRPARPGQFCHLRAGTWARSRPFSVVRADPGTGVLEFAVKDAGPVTRRLRALPVGALLRLDGPYGAFTSQAQGGDAPAVLIAGGVGVTPSSSWYAGAAGPSGCTTPSAPPRRRCSPRSWPTASASDTRLCPGPLRCTTARATSSAGARASWRRYAPTCAAGACRVTGCSPRGSSGEGESCPDLSLMPGVVTTVRGYCHCVGDFAAWTARI
ncbi:ferric reductase-like transmembrane domain-containing protein [Thermocatellispora tengchongensis]|uniref:ferric reductase-like transmembrane domain-containing protein n=1 Tax=Thermocatellispora tengchongensis TaxID=1073253 RepID=UPI00362850FC